MHGFVDEPFDDSNSGIWTDVFRENHIRELPNRKIDYAISMFKKEHNAIYRKILTSDELESLLCGEQLLPDEFSFVDDTLNLEIAQVVLAMVGRFPFLILIVFGFPLEWIQLLLIL